MLLAGLSFICTTQTKKQEDNNNNLCSFLRSKTGKTSKLLTLDFQAIHKLSLPTCIFFYNTVVPCRMHSFIGWVEGQLGGGWSDGWNNRWMGEQMSRERGRGESSVLLGSWFTIIFAIVLQDLMRSPRRWRPTIFLRGHCHEAVHMIRNLETVSGDDLQVHLLLRPQNLSSLACILHTSLHFSFYWSWTFLCKF